MTNELKWVGEEISHAELQKRIGDCEVQKDAFVKVPDNYDGKHPITANIEEKSWVVEFKEQPKAGDTIKISILGDKCWGEIQK